MTAVEAGGLSSATRRLDTPFATVSRKVSELGRISRRGSAAARSVDSRPPMRVTDGVRGGREELLEFLGPWPELDLPGPGTARLP